ncbi:MAG: hydrogenase iron-sulfur subunit [Candidatus Lokiarchaeota archaeon]
MDVYSILSHDLRKNILQLLEREGYLQYTDLMEKLGIDKTGKLNFHLNKLGSLIDKDEKFYYLTEDGKRVLKIINLNKRILAGEDIQEYFDREDSNINRVGVIICDCNSEISNVINVNALEDSLSKLESVISIKIYNNLCQEKNFNNIKTWVKENFLNKIVIAACSPKSHQHQFERIFEDIVEASNIEIANIREQCVWAHLSRRNYINPFIVLEKAKLLIEAAIKRVCLQKTVKLKRVEVEKSCAVIGGGIAGMQVSLNLAKAGIKVFLVEKSPTIGGKVARWHRIYGMSDCSICFISELIGEIVAQKNITILTNTEVEDVSGEVGNFTINLNKKPRFVDVKKCTCCQQCIEVCSLQKPNKFEFNLKNRKCIYIPFINAYPNVPLIDENDLERCRSCRICERVCQNGAINLDQKPEKVRIKVGAKVIAIGADLAKNLEKYHYDPQEDIITSAEFERILSSDGIFEGKVLKISDKTPPKTISVVQDVGPEEYENEFNDFVALKYLNCVKVKDPTCEVNIFCNLKRFNKNQQSFLKSFDPSFVYANDIEIVKKEEKNIVIADSIEFQSDLIVLNINLVPNKNLTKLRKIMDFTLNENGFMSEETLASGIYGVGTIFGPLSYETVISQANDVAIRIISLLSKDHLIAEFSGIEIDNDKCSYCGLCSVSCPFNAIILEDEKINVDTFKCKGCGTCVSVCPSNAVEMNIDTTEKILGTIEILSKFKSKPKIIAFCCNSCGYAAADDAGIKKFSYNPNIFIVKVPCAGRIDTNFIIHAFEQGFDGIMIIGCKEDACRYINGLEKAAQKIDLLKNVIGNGISQRILLKNLNAVEGSKFAEISNEFYNRLLEVI